MTPEPGVLTVEEIRKAGKLLQEAAAQLDDPYNLSNPFSLGAAAGPYSRCVAPRDLVIVSEIPSETHNQASYLEPVLPSNRLRETLDKAMYRLKDVQFDTIAVSGVSGLLIGPVLAYLMKKELIVIRKRTEGSHSCRPLEGHVAAKRYVMVDDLIAMGTTMVRIHRAIKKEVPDAYPVAIYLYYDNELYKPGEDGFDNIMEKSASPLF